MTYYGVTNNSERRPKAFSKLEIRDITVSVLVLTIAFTIILTRGNPRFFSTDQSINIACWALVSLILVITSFMMHEMGHKFTAQRYGAWAEYRSFPLGLLVCLLLSFTGVLFAAPGAVYIAGDIDDTKNGKISAAGPGVNIILGYVAYLLALLLYSVNSMASSIFLLMAYLNAFLAIFNMIPIMPLDGSKIVKWDIPFYILMVILAGALLYLTW
jgi:Zn-dependent protease